MAKKKIYTQYSKKLTTAIMIYWGIIRLVAFIIVAINQETGCHLVDLIHGVDDIAMVNVLAYTGNSVSEKVAISYFKTKKYLHKSCSDEDEEEDKEEDNEDEEENG